MMDRLQSYVLHGFSPRLFSAGVVTVWRRNVEVWWIIFRPKKFSYQSFILTQPQDSYSGSPLSVDRHGVWAALLFARLGFRDLFSKSENIFLSDLAGKKPQTYFVMEYASPRIIKQRTRVTPPKTPEMM